jgi:hypothetical protein
MERLDDWLMALASPLLPLQEVPVGPPGQGGYQWAFRETSERALLVGKAVRMISAVRAALILADAGYVTECGTLLRTVQDFRNEIFAVCEGCKSGQPTRAQKEFVQQYFAPVATTAEEFDKQERAKWVTRDELLKSYVRGAPEVGENPDRTRKEFRFQAHGYDKYVHGAYITAMDLYNGATQRFMLSGHESAEYRILCKRMVASLLHDVVAVLCHIAAVEGMPALVEEIALAERELYNSDELIGGSTSG